MSTSPQISVVDHSERAERPAAYKPSHRAESKTGGRLRLAGAALSVTAATVGVGLGLDTIGDSLPLVQDIAADGMISPDTELGDFGDGADFDLVAQAAQGGRAVTPGSEIWDTVKLPAGLDGTGSDDAPTNGGGADGGTNGNGSDDDNGGVDPIDGPDGDGTDGVDDGEPGTETPGTETPGGGNNGGDNNGGGGAGSNPGDSIDETVDEVTDTVDGGSGQGDIVDEVVDEVTDTVGGIIGNGGGNGNPITGPVTGVLGDAASGLPGVGGVLGKFIAFASLQGLTVDSVVVPAPVLPTAVPVIVEPTTSFSAPVLPTAVPSILVTESAWTTAR